MDNEAVKKLFTKKEICYYVMVDKFFKRCQPEMITKMINIIDGEDAISLRILDWYVTRYAKKHMENINNGFDDDSFDVHINYKAQLKTYKKKYFDPFRRKTKFNYVFKIGGGDKTLVTTIGQLNFFSWAIKNNVLSCVDKSLSQITKAMNLSNKEDKKKKEDKKRTSGSDDDSDDDIDADVDSDSDGDNVGVGADTDVAVKRKNNVNINVEKKIEDDEVELTFTI